MLELFGWLGDLFLVAGMWGMGSRRRGAHLVTVAGECLWTLNAAVRHDWALAAICVVFGVMAMRAWVLWGR